MPKLLEMLGYKRPHGSESEATFIAKFIDTVPGMTQDAFGNRLLRLGHSTTLFSSPVTPTRCIVIPALRSSSMTLV